MTTKHRGERWGVGSLARRAGIATSTLEAYIARGQCGVPPACFEPSEGNPRAWCAYHGGAWVNDRKMRRAEHES